MRIRGTPSFKRHDFYSKTAAIIATGGLGRWQTWSSSIRNKQWMLPLCRMHQQGRLYAGQGLTNRRSSQSSELGRTGEHFQDLLSQAARYSIHEVKTLEFESAVDSCEGRSTRLVEDPSHQFDYELWVLLLHYRMRVYGDAGIKTVWNFLTRPDQLENIPASWPTQDILWRVFVDLGLRDHEFLTRISKHAEQLWRQRKMRRSALFVEVIGGLLNGENSAAGPLFSKTMHVGSPISSEELLKIFIQASASKNTRALEHFRLICDLVPYPKIYGTVIQRLCGQGRLEEAVSMHNYLIRRHDYPKRFEEVEPLVRLIAEGGLDLSALTRQMEGSGLSFNGRVQRLYPSIKDPNWLLLRESMNSATGDTFGIRPSRISDTFMARLFATRSFSFELVVQGLHVLGIEEVGPLSLRQIALQAGTPSLIQQRLAKLDSIGIDTGWSAYSRVVRKLVREREDKLLMDILHCDQHPDVFEDQEIQLRLLYSHHEGKDWQGVNRALAILDTSGSSERHASNGLLRSSLKRQDWPEVMNLVSQMHQAGKTISRANMILMYQSMLIPRTSQQRVSSSSSDFQDLTALITVWQSSLKSGTTLPSNVWREPLRRLIMTGRWVDLHKACLWLCSFYLPKSISSNVNSKSTSFKIQPIAPPSCNKRHLSVVKEIFSPEFQSAIIDWGFSEGMRAGKREPKSWPFPLTNNMELREAPWICGLELLCDLRERFGVQLCVPAIKKAFQGRLRPLSLAEGDSKLARNDNAKMVNSDSLQYYFEWINRTYGQTLFDRNDPWDMSGN